MEKPEVLDLIIEFGGGAEFLFGNIKKHEVQLVQENSSKWTIRKLIRWLEKNLLKERPELFIQDDSVRPGILVLINDADWELMNPNLGSYRDMILDFRFKENPLQLDGTGELDYELKNNDNILFISTLHGG